jgi:hypothetical protein
MELPTYFSDFLADIRLTENQRSDAITGHRTLRDRLAKWEDFSPLIVSTFLQGSYRRATAVRPYEERRADVDVIVVTRLSHDEFSPKEIVPIFIPFLDEHYEDKWELQGRSFGIKLSYVDLDMVVTAAPSEGQIGIYESADVTDDETLDEAAILTETTIKKAAEWQDTPLLIPDRELDRWDETDPLEQIRWTQQKNARCEGHYVNVVKAVKWWRRVNCPEPKYPKGYPVEHIIGVCCPDGIASVAEGVTTTLEAITANYAGHVAINSTPFLADHGVPAHNVLARVSGEDFATFHLQCSAAAKTARAALDSDGRKNSADLWRILFGSKFPPAPDDDDDGSGARTNNGPSGGYSKRDKPTEISEGRFA